MAEKLSLQERAELVLIVGDKYNINRLENQHLIFTKRHPGKNIYYSTVFRIYRNGLIGMV